ncbi:MAG TPA: hypothetical protein VMW83_16270 [Spirochaetia bacterium]|nr:hypothetical protein [Spirochaetia bacterium]
MEILPLEIESGDLDEIRASWVSGRKSGFILPTERGSKDDGLLALRRPLIWLPEVTGLDLWLMEEKDQESPVGDDYRLTIPESMRANVRMGDILIWHYDEREKVFMLAEKSRHDPTTIETNNYDLCFEVIKSEPRIRYLL